MGQNYFIPKNSLAEYFDENYNILEERFREQGSIFIYPIGEINRELYNKLSQFKKWNEAFEPKEFFNLLYEQLNKILIAEDEESFPGVIINELESLNLEPTKYGFLTFALSFVINKMLCYLDPKELVFEQHLKNRPLRKLQVNLLWNYQKIIEKIGDKILPVNFDPVKNILESKQIALIFFYNGEIIPDDKNGAIIAAKYNRCKKTSGHELYQDFTFFKKSCNRRGDPGTRIKMERLINLIKGILEYLNETGLQQANGDLKILEIIVNKYY